MPHLCGRETGGGKHQTGAALMLNVAVILEERSAASLFMGGMQETGFPAATNGPRLQPLSIRVFNQVTLSVTGLNMRDASHNTHGHLFLDLVPVLPAETSL